MFVIIYTRERAVAFFFCVSRKRTAILVVLLCFILLTPSIYVKNIGKSKG